MCVAHIDYACSLFNKCKNGVLKMYVVFAILLIRFLKRHIAISKNKIFTIVQSRPFYYPAYICTYKKVGTVSGDPPQGRNSRRRPALSNYLKLSLSFNPDRFSSLRIFANYKKGGTVSGDSPQGRNLKRHIAALVAVFVGDEDYFYSVLVTLMSHYDIIVANSVGT